MDISFFLSVPCQLVLFPLIVICTSTNSSALLKYSYAVLSVHVCYVPCPVLPQSRVRNDALCAAFASTWVLHIVHLLFCINLE